MKLILKIFLLFTVLALVFIISFELWGEQFENLLNPQRCVAWFERIRPMAWIVAIGLLVADLVLPVPATGIMAALGSVYGVLIGTLVSAAGSTLAGIAGYGCARLIGRGGIRWLATDEELSRFQDFFERWGAVGIIVSRISPILPEVMALLAGVARMNFSLFLAALLLGTVPTAFLFSFLGHTAKSAPLTGMLIATLLPLAIWPFVRKFVFDKPQPAS